MLWSLDGGVWLVNKKAYTQDTCLETLVANLAVDDIGLLGFTRVTPKSDQETLNSDIK